MHPVTQQFDSAFHEMRECFKTVDDVLEGRLDLPLSSRRLLMAQMHGYLREIAALLQVQKRQATETPQNAPEAKTAVLTPSCASDAT